MARVRLSLSHREDEDSPSCLLRLLLALSSNWIALFIPWAGFVFSILWKAFVFAVAFAFVLALCQAAIRSLLSASTLTPMAQMKPSSSRPTAVMILR